LRTSYLKLLVAFVALSSCGSVAGASELDELMGLLATRQHGRVEFVEQQFLHILDHPIES
jgi:hypothetical protein